MSVFMAMFLSVLWASFTGFFRSYPAVQKANERKAEAEEISRIIGMLPTMATATVHGLQINSLFQLLLITKEMWIEGCPCTQKSRHWKGILAFQDEYFKSKKSESFVTSYNKSMHAGIKHDISDIHLKSSGSLRYVKSPKS